MDAYSEGQTVWVKIGERSPMQMRVLEKLAGGMYRLDWTLSGFSEVLNTVKVSGSSMSSEPQE